MRPGAPYLTVVPPLAGAPYLTVVPPLAGAPYLTGVPYLNCGVRYLTHRGPPYLTGAVP